MKKVAHPNCVLLHEVYDESNKTYMVLDLITGGTVMVCMCPSKSLPCISLRVSLPAPLSVHLSLRNRCVSWPQDRIIEIDHFSEKDAASVTADVSHIIQFSAFLMLYWHARSCCTHACFIHAVMCVCV